MKTPFYSLISQRGSKTPLNIAVALQMIRDSKGKKFTAPAQIPTQIKFLLIHLSTDGFNV